MPVVPQAQVTRRDAAFACHGSGFSEDKTGSADCPAAEVNKMPVIGKAIDSAILTHWRDDDAVVNCDAPDGEGA
jgi:hypothetical protein